MEEYEEFINPGGDYFSKVENSKFEEMISELSMIEVCDMPEDAPNEVKMQYLVHVFSKALDEVAQILLKPVNQMN